MFILLDNTVLTNFARVGLAHTMLKLWEKKVFTTGDVFKEYQVGVKVSALPPRAWGEMKK